ncbi:SDR family NAD(P)-dependent oxidoreductase [Amycolatopsis thermophila]|uniref:NAD(P)-dependent dehydrogenase (Short-subunit alcohol dehydrogenase family) n=1 Tax=Amycolatopsis thermophila TaxID=206084 RepID=A0ABU0F5D4_9PSEU|nr:SDR family NAD(P)-dependent oxidoreductase [Amycolatopsis thermophila]MDQ0382708.1 NAD(P)-dependent dehydrogenase (short-subunit alcohol dehydrogenase family) [Amycolatopsis thermophila]
MRIEGGSAIVTGGAGGLGSASVRRLAGAGASVVIADLDEERGKTLADELGPKVIFVRTDVTDEDDVQRAVDAAAELGPVRVSVCVHSGPVAKARVVNRKGATYPLETFRRTTEIYLVGTFSLMQKAAAAMAEAPELDSGLRGVVINTASIAAFEGQVGQSDYSAAKGGVVSLGLVGARDLAPLGIRVMTIAPGTFFTPAYRMPEEEAQAKWGPGIPAPKRMGSVDEYAKLVMQIVDNDYLNGEVIRIDGAQRFS